MPSDLLPLAVLVAIAPGFLTIYFATHGRTGQPIVPDLRLVLQSLVISAVLLAVLGPFAFAALWPVRNKLELNVGTLVLWTGVLFLIAPYLAGRLSRAYVAWIDRNPQNWMSNVFRVAFPAAVPPTLWDWSALQGFQEGRFVVVEYTDGTRIGGAYGKPGIVLTSPEEHGIFLASEWKLDATGLPIEQIVASAGVLIPLRDDVRSVRFFNPAANGTKESDADARNPAEQDRPARRNQGRNPGQN
jgi:hypothetical protein